MILTVTPNPALDMTYHMSSIHFGESHRVSAPAVRAGGKGLNVARVLHSLGHPVISVSPFGGSTGNELANELMHSEVPHRLVPVQRATRRTVTMVETGGRTSIFNEQGENHSAKEWDALAQAVESCITGAHCVVGSGSLPPNADPSFFAELVNAAHARGVPAIIDTSGPPLLAAAKAGADVLKPNSQELMEATGDGHPLRAAHSLLELGAGMILLSLGEKGMVALCRDEEDGYHAGLSSPLAGNPTGAGDAAVAAVASLLSQEITDATTTLRQATAWSAAAVLMPLAGEIAANHATLADDVILRRLASTDVMEIECL